ncbi:hypothetical protein ES706_00018 [subsurface metagenome]|nr:hypothetical protein [Hadesarchaea archaeon]
MSVEELIKELITEIDKNPFRFRMEADVRAWLYNKLCGEYRELYKTRFPRENPLKTSLVHCEYFGGKGRRIDLVVFDEGDVGNITTNWMDNGPNNPTRLSDAIEIKMELGYRGKDQREKIAISDVDRLIELKRDGKTRRAYFIFIVRWPTRNEKRQDEIRCLREKLRKKCEEDDVKFYTNNNYFLGRLPSMKVMSPCNSATNKRLRTRANSPFNFCRDRPQLANGVVHLYHRLIQDLARTAEKKEKKSLLKSKKL